MSERPYFEQLEVWQLAHALALEVYRLVGKFPAVERFRLVDQLCRAASSVPANLAEGEGRQQLADQIHFVHMARASLSETRYFLVLGRDLGFVEAGEEARLNELCGRLHSKLNAFIASKRRFAATQAMKLETRNVKRSSIRAFTLIELLTVIAIIVVLAGLVVGISSYANRHAIESRTKSEIAAICSALEHYKADYGTYPPLDADALANSATSTNGGLTNIFLSAVSVPAGYAVPNTNGWLNVHFAWRALSGTNPANPKVYMVFSPKQLKAITNAASTFVYTVILDPNGNPYGYNPVAPVANPQGFDFWSAGVDGKSSYPNLSSTNDDLGNWQR